MLFSDLLLFLLINCSWWYFSHWNRFYKKTFVSFICDFSSSYSWECLFVCQKHTFYFLFWLHVKYTPSINYMLISSFIFYTNLNCLFTIYKGQDADNVLWKMKVYINDNLICFQKHFYTYNTSTFYFGTYIIQLISHHMKFCRVMAGDLNTCTFIMCKQSIDVQIQKWACILYF
jgi:hypothetical protein